jgi:hypothetical protein
MNSEDAPKFREDEFVFRIVRDPENPPEVLLIAAFLGKASKQSYTRLYLDPLLSAFADVPSEDVLHAEPLPKAQSPFGGYYVWIRRDPYTLRAIQEGYQRSAQILQEVSTGAQVSTPVFSPMSSGWPNPVTGS